MRYVVATLTGVATVAAFAPLSWSMIGVAATAVLFYLWLDCSPKQGAMVGFLYGLGLFGAGVSWVYVSLHDFGGMPVALAVITVCLFVLILAAFPAAVGWGQARWFRPGLLRAVVVVPALWLIAEWMRGWVLSGFPWLALGYTQVGHALAGFAPVAGVYAVSAAVALAAGALAALARAPRLVPLAAAALIAAGLWAAGIGLSKLEWVKPLGPAKPVTLVQGNVPLLVKWSSVERPKVLEIYRTLSRNSNSQLVIWPEAAIPYYVDELSPEFWQWLRAQSADFVFGVLERRPESGTTAYYNSVLAVSERTSVYRKVHLVPFGEYLPFASLLGWLLDYLHIPMSDFSSWTGPQKLPHAAGIALGITVCYEDAFPTEVRKALPDAALLVNVSEDAWFGDSLAPHQRLQMARMRALEGGRPMLRAANTGPSAIIDHRGRITHQSAQFVATKLEGEVQPMSGATPYVRFGDGPVLALAFGLVVLGLVVCGPRRGSDQEQRRQSQ